MTETLRRQASEPVELREAASGAVPTASSRRAARLWGAALLVVVVASVVAASWTAGPLLRPEGFSLVGNFLGAALRPATDVAFLQLIASAAVTTVAYAVLGTVLSLVLGLVGGVLSSEVWWLAGRHERARRRGAAGWAMVRGVLVLPRAIHEVIWGLIFLSVLGLTPLVAVLAIGIPFGAVTAKVFAELLDETPRRAYTAALASGTPRLTALLYTLMPAAWSDLLSYGFYRFECAIRSAAILGLIGAGGLGFQLALSLQTLNYPEVWTALYALILLSAATDLWSSAVRRRRASGAGASDRVIGGSLVAGAVLVVGALWWVQLDLAVLVAGDTWQLVLQILEDAWPPGLGGATVLGLLQAALITVAMSVLAIVIAFAGASALAFPGAAGTALSPGRWLVVLVTRGFLIVLRALPPPVWALLFLFVMAPGVLPGAMALGVYTLGVLGRLMTESVENLDRRPQEAMRAHGVPRPTVFCYAVVPAAAPRFVAFGLYRWEVTIRETVVVGVVGAGGLGLVLNQQLAAFDYSAAVTTLGVIVLLTAMVDATSAGVRRSLR
ncbi:PhnE/PtxC family ABC transporter permease [Actinomycetospora straminea]|uniref:Phosphate ABC transporter permease n=1 Tax=Actinomycetospora straminea TaxID=663607 RepID=A0ABP9F9L7_9PSEU|nr:ABC transporter permease subunit [Actinomycetospora straminea]MDD7934801.1 ABC transporter permease subunit [Actinomycetospora straminea]